MSTIKLPQLWKKNPAARANLKTYSSATTTYSASNVTYSSVVVGEPVSTIKKPHTWSNAS